MVVKPMDSTDLKEFNMRLKYGIAGVKNISVMVFEFLETGNGQFLDAELFIDFEHTQPHPTKQQSPRILPPT